MIQLHILSGKTAGSRVDASRFPFRVGRGPQNNLPLEDDGVWEQHITLEFRKKEGFHLATMSEAIAAVNGKPITEALLRNGDIITVGSAKIQFWLAPAPQHGLGLRENLVWALLLLVVLSEVALIITTLR